MKRFLGAALLALSLTGCVGMGGMLSAGGYVDNVYVSGAVMTPPAQPIYYQPVYPVYQPVYPSVAPRPMCGPRRGYYYPEMRCNNSYPRWR